MKRLKEADLIRERERQKRIEVSHTYYYKAFGRIKRKEKLLRRLRSIQSSCSN
jgi:hypothetical protein